MKYLDTRVEEDIAWVHSHCDMNNSVSTMSTRTIARCRSMALDRIFMVYTGFVQTTLVYALTKWRACSNYERLRSISKVYCRAKGIEMLSRVLHCAVCNQLLKAWIPWLNGVKAQKKKDGYGD